MRPPVSHQVPQSTRRFSVLSDMYYQTLSGIVSHAYGIYRQCIGVVSEFSFLGFLQCAYDTILTEVAPSMRPPVSEQVPQSTRRFFVMSDMCHQTISDIVSQAYYIHRQCIDVVAEFRLLRPGTNTHVIAFSQGGTVDATTCVVPGASIFSAFLCVFRHVPSYMCSVFA